MVPTLQTVLGHGCASCCRPLHQRRRHSRLVSGRTLPVRQLLADKQSCQRFKRGAALQVRAGQQLTPDQLDEIAKELLQTDPEAAAQLKRYEAALARVAKAQAAKEELDIMLKEAAEAAMSTEEEERLQKQKAGEIMAAAEEKAAKKLLEAAELEYQLAQVNQNKWADAVVDDLERLESGKAAGVAVVGGLLGSIPLALADASPNPTVLLSIAVTAATCLLFGVTYRYAVRRDAGNVHLRAGVVAAFGLAKGLAGVDVMEQAAAAAGQNPLALEVVGPAALYAGQSILAIAFAAAALEAAFQSKLVRRFGELSAQ